MSKVKRYEMKTTYRGHESWDSLEEDKDGGYVNCEDYAALEAKFAALAALVADNVERDSATLEYDYLNDQIEYWKNKSINITEQRNELAAENAMLNQRTQQLIDIISNTDNDYCMCGSAMKDHMHRGCGYPTGMFDYYYNQWLVQDNKTPATDAFLAEVRASAIPEGYVLVPQQIFLEPSDIESICSQCGDGHESGYGDFTDGLLWVGNIQRDDGSIVHGLHISSADYSEEGGVTVCEFAAQLRKEGNQ